MTRPSDLAPLIDHTALGVGVSSTDVDRLCDEAVAHGFASVCIQPIWVPRALAQLQGRAVMVCSVVGFPMGQNLSESKASEAGRLVELGAHELDMVVPWGALLRGEGARVEADIHAVVEAASGRTVKVILETAGLDDSAIRLGCRAAMAAGAHFVKTSTGFGPGGASVEAVRLMREVVGTAMGVKASGGIRDAATARAMVDAGASRLGCSASLTIVGAA